jgi:Rad3-related DNA helicase
MARRESKPLEDERILDLEERLAGTLKPIEPPKEFVVGLRERIRIPDRREIASRLSDWRRMFLVFGGIMSAMVLVITVARAFFYLFGRRHM